MNTPGEWTIAHVFADEGVESEALTLYGTVYRFGLDPSDTNDSIPIRADARSFPVRGDKFDLMLFHPSCHKWTQRDDEDAPNYIPLCRELAEKHADEYIIENQPDAPLKNRTVLNGYHFGLPIHYERAFETSYSVPSPPPVQRQLAEHRVENTRPKRYWLNVKGYTSTEYKAKDLILSGTPRAYIDYLLRPLL